MTILRVSVIVPTHNRRVLLQRLLASLAAQSLPGGQFEIIIVHNHTDDGTEEMARAWCLEQAATPGAPLTRYFRKNYKGPARSRQFGAGMAGAGVLAYVDDDCVATPDWLASGLAAFGPGVGLVQGRTLPAQDQVQRFPWKTVTVDRATVYFETCNIFYSRAAFDAVGGFSDDFLDLFYGEDTDLGWKVTQEGFTASFATGALVYHEIFHVTLYKWLAEPLFFKNLPFLVKKHPALRASMFGHYFLTRETFLFNVLLIALLLAPWHPWLAAALAVPYFVVRFRHAGGLLQCCARVVLGLPRGLFTWWALVTGSIRARSVLL